MKFRPYLFQNIQVLGRNFNRKRTSRVGIRMGFLIAKHILYSGKTMDQTNEILFIQEKKRDCKTRDFSVILKGTKCDRGGGQILPGAGKRSAAHVKNNEVDQ